MKNFLCVLSFFALGFSVSAHANDFKESASKLCDHITSCMIEQMSMEEDMPQHLKDMATTMSKSMCESLYAFEELSEFADRDDIKQGATACYESVLKQDCSAIQDGFETPECQSFEVMMEK